MKKVFFVLDHKHSEIQDYSAAIIYWYGVLDRMGYEVVYEDYAKYNPDEFYKKVREEKPYMVILVNYFRAIHTEFSRFRDITKVYLLQTDMHRFYDEHVKLWIPYVDGIINYEGTKEWCLRDGLPEEGFLRMRWGFNPNMMCYSQNTKTKGISFYGGMHGDRAQILSTLSRQIPVDIIPQSATYEQVKQVLSESNFSLNLSMNAPANRRELKGRVIEIPAHCILLSESAPELETYYNEDEFILFNSVEEAIEKVKSLDDKQVVDLFRRGNKALWERNTAYHEWNKILPLMDPDYKEVDVNKLVHQYHSEFIHYEH
jgi:hypothetical protein